MNRKQMYETIGGILSFYDRWKGIGIQSGSGYTTLRNKRNREAWKLIRQIVEAANKSTSLGHPEPDKGK